MLIASAFVQHVVWLLTVHTTLRVQEKTLAKEQENKFQSVNLSLRVQINPKVEIPLCVHGETSAPTNQNMGK